MGSTFLQDVAPPHPLLPLSPTECSLARDIITGQHKSEIILSFRSIYLQEPKKAELTPFLADEHAGRDTQATARPPRQAKVEYFTKSGEHSQYCEAIVDIKEAKEVSVKKFDPKFPVSMSL